VFSLGRRPGLDARVVWRLARLICRKKVSVLHTHHTGALVYGVPAALIAGLGTVVHTEHSHDVLDSNPRLRVAERLLTRFAWTTTCVTEEVQEYLSRRVGISPRRLVVLPNGVDTKLFVPGPADPALLEELCLVGHPVVGTVGRLDPLKDHESLLRAFAAVHSAVPKARLVIVGDGPLRDHLRNMAKELGVEDAVYFTGARSDVAALLRAFDVFVLSSTHEGLPLALLEAMSAGLPVVATAVGGVPRAVEHGVSGFVCPPGDAETLSSLILHLLEHRELRAVVGRNARVRVESHFSVERMVAGYKDIYEAARGGRQTWTLGKL
ncbi:MAG: glycosyltransferase, partial [Armatimonadota bacterium]